MASTSFLNVSTGDSKGGYFFYDVLVTRADLHGVRSNDRVTLSDVNKQK